MCPSTVLHYGIAKIYTYTPVKLWATELLGSIRVSTVMRSGTVGYMRPITCGTHRSPQVLKGWTIPLVQYKPNYIASNLAITSPHDFTVHIADQRHGGGCRHPTPTTPDHVTSPRTKPCYTPPNPTSHSLHQLLWPYSRPFQPTLPHTPEHHPNNPPRPYPITP